MTNETENSIGEQLENWSNENYDLDPSLEVLRDDHYLCINVEFMGRNMINFIESYGFELQLIENDTENMVYLEFLNRDMSE